jgi:hypothetical protein
MDAGVDDSDLKCTADHARALSRIDAQAAELARRIAFIALPISIVRLGRV